MSDFNVRDYGAAGDGRTLDTVPLQAAIDACHNAGGGIVQCCAGIYLAGSIELLSNVELYLAPGCTLLGSADLGDYCDFTAEGFCEGRRGPEGTVKYLIGAHNATNIAINGAGTIDAAGEAFYDGIEIDSGGKFARKPEQRPRILMLHKCRDVRIEAATFVNSPCWTLWFMLCERVQIHRIKILGDPRMRNNDGIDIDGCRDVTISDCLIRTEDDCIVLRAMQPLHADPAVCENVVVSNCILESTCQCVRISCPSDHITRNCAFSNITMTSRANGINFDFPERYVSPGAMAAADVSNISFSNVTIRSGAHPVRIAAGEGVRLVRVAGISFSGMRMESGAPCLIQGNSDTLVEDVGFSDIRLATTGPQAFVCKNCRGVTFDNVRVENLDAGSARN